MPALPCRLAAERPTRFVIHENDTMSRFTLFVVFFLTSNAQSQELRKGGSPFARIESNGDVRIQGKIVGRFESDGDIRVKGAIVGRIERDGDIRKKGSIVGRVDKDGDVRMGGRIVGKIEADGDVRKGGAIIGRAAGVKKEQAAAIFFFGFFE